MNKSIDTVLVINDNECTRRQSSLPNRGDFMKFRIDFNTQNCKFIVTAEGMAYNGSYIDKMDSFECYLKAKQQDQYNRATY